MVILNRIYTRTGDDGTTALGNGERRPKHDLRVCAYGCVDEANSALGVARLHVTDARLDTLLLRVQNDLFDLGADLCMPPTETGETGDAPTHLRVSGAQVSRLEHEIDTLNQDLTPLRSFVLPGGTPAAAHLHVARTIVRRAERLVVELAARSQGGNRIGEPVLLYLNRLSDLLFVAARHANDKGAGDVLWQPGENQ